MRSLPVWTVVVSVLSLDTDPFSRILNVSAAVWVSGSGSLMCAFAVKSELQEENTRTSWSEPAQLV